MLCRGGKAIKKQAREIFWCAEGNALEAICYYELLRLFEKLRLFEN